MNQGKKIIRSVSKSIVSSSKSVTNSNSDKKNRNCFYLCSLLKKQYTMKQFQGFVKIVASTNKSYERNARLRNIAMLFKFRQRKNLMGGLKKIKSMKIKHQLLMTLTRRIMNSAQKVNKSTILASWNALKSCSKQNLEQVEQIKQVNKKTPFRKKNITEDTPIRQMKGSNVSADSSLLISRSNKSLSQSSSRVLLRKQSHHVLAEDLDPKTLDLVSLKQENQELKIMALSKDAIESLKKLQRFDRFIFPMESDRILKKPIQQELRRLEKIKNLREQMRGKIYDNELLITALYNHIKLVFQMNRELQEREVLRKQKNEAQKKMHQMKQQNIKQVRQLKQQLRLSIKNHTPMKIQGRKVDNSASKNVSSALKKEEETTLNFITATLKGNKLPEALGEINKFLDKYYSSQPDMCRIFSLFVPAVEQQIEANSSHKILQKKLVDLTNAIDKSNRIMRANHFDELEKLKNQLMSPNSSQKNLGLLIESVFNVQKASEQQKKKKRTVSEDGKGIQKISKQVKMLQDQLKEAKEQLLKEKSENAETLKLKVSLQKQLQHFKKNQQQFKSKEEMLQRNQAEGMQKIKKNITHLQTAFEQITKAMSSSNTKVEFQKVKRTMASDISTRKYNSIVDDILNLHNKCASLEKQAATKEQQQKKKMLESAKKSNDKDLVEIKRETSSISQSLKNVVRSWNKTKPQILLKDNKIIQIMRTELKKSKLQNLENLSSDLISVFETGFQIVSGQIKRQADNILHQKQVLSSKLEEKSHQIEDTKKKTQEINLLKKQLNTIKIQKQKITSKYNQAKADSETLKKNMSEINQLKKQNSKLKNEKQNLQSSKEKNLAQLQNLKKSIKETESQNTKMKSKQQNEKIRIINTQLAELKNQNVKIANQKQVLENHYQEVNQEVSRLKKLTQDYVQQEKKMLRTLEQQRKEKEQKIRILESTQRTVERMQKEKQFFSTNMKKHDSQIIKLKEMELMYESTVHDFQMKITSLQNSLKSKEKQLKTFQQRNDLLLQEKDRAERNQLEIQKTFSREKDENERKRKNLEQNLQFVEKQKQDLSKEVDKLTQQIRYELDEREADKKHYGNIISKLEKSITEKGNGQQIQIKELQNKILILVQQKEQIKFELEKEQIRYREKLKDLTQNLQVSEGSKDFEKQDMKRNMKRIQTQYETLNSIYQKQKKDFKSHIQKLQLEILQLTRQKNQEKRVHREQLQRVRNEQYEINYQKIKKQREDLRRMQEEMDKLTEIIEINEVNYNKIVEDNKDMYDRILELERQEGNLTEQNQRLKNKSRYDENDYMTRSTDLNQYVGNLEKKIKQFETIINTSTTQIDLARSKHQESSKQLQYKIDELNRENIRLRTHLEETLKFNSRLEQQNHHIKETNTQLDREVFGLKQSALMTEQLHRTPSRQDLEHIFQEKYHSEINSLTHRIGQFSSKNQELSQQKIRLQILLSNSQRHLQDKQSQLLRYQTTINELKMAVRDKDRDIQEFQRQNLKLESSLHQVQKQFFVKQMSFKQQVQTLQSRISALNNSNQDIQYLKQENSNLGNQIRNVKQDNFQLQRQIIRRSHDIQQKEKHISYLQKQLQDKKTIIIQREAEFRQYMSNMSKSLQESKSTSNINIPDMTGTVNILERAIEDKKRQIQRLQAQLDTTNRKWEEKNIQSSAIILELKHSKMEREMIENNYKQRLDFQQEKNQQLQREIQGLKSEFHHKKTQLQNQIHTIISEKQHTERNLQEAERRYQSSLRQLDSIIKDFANYKQSGKNNEGMAHKLSREMEDIRAERNMLKQNEDENKRMISKLNHKILVLDQTNHRENQRMKDDYQRKINTLQRQLESKKETINQRDRQIRQYTQKMAVQSSETLGNSRSGRQDFQYSLSIYEKTNNDLKKDNQALQNQLQGISRRLEDKIRQNSALSLEIKQFSMEKQMLEEHNRLRVENLSDRNNDFAREISQLKTDINNMEMKFENEKRSLLFEREKLQRNLAEYENRNQTLENQLHKSKSQQIGLEQSKRNLQQICENQGEELRRVESHFKMSRYRKIKKDGGYLKEIAQMLDQNYSDDSEDDENEIKILMKISEEISDLVDRNKHLQNQLSLFQGQGSSDEKWYQSLQLLIQSILQFLSENSLIGHKNVTKFVYSADFQGQSLYEHRQKYFMYVENFLKELFNNIVEELTENTDTYIKTLSDIKVFIEEHVKTGERSYLQAVRKNLRKLDL